MCPIQVSFFEDDLTVESADAESIKGSSSSSTRQVVKIESSNSLNFVLDKTSHGSNDDSSELSVDNSNSTYIVKKCDPPVYNIPAELISTDGDDQNDITLLLLLIRVVAVVTLQNLTQVEWIYQHHLIKLIL